MTRVESIARLSTPCITLGLLITGCSTQAELSDEAIDNIVRRSFQYVVMYNVINKGAMMPENPMMAPWNTTKAAPGLLDHTIRGIARPNNDTLYVSTLLDLRAEPIIVHYPAFDSQYVVLETSAYDHYIDIPLSTTEGDFKEPTKVLYYTARTEGYSGEPVEGVDIVKEMTGDFAGAFLRVMPHAAEPERMERNLAAMQEVQVQSLSEYLGNPAKPVAEAAFPAYSSGAGVYENNFLEVMQFVFNHTTFDPMDSMDQEILATLEPLGIEPGKEFDPRAVTEIDGTRLAEVARQIVRESLATWNRPEGNPYQNDVFLPKGQMTLEPMVVQSAFGPIGLPTHQAVYPAIPTASGEPMNAQNDYVIRMSPVELPPAKAFWSVTLYDAETGQFIPNDRKKYSVGENAGMKLDDDGGIEIHVAAERLEGVPEENWLPINRKDEDMNLVMRIYAPDPGRLATWTAPRAEIVE